jgi:peptide-methionine (S)-S-oxide reductase
VWRCFRLDLNCAGLHVIGWALSPAVRHAGRVGASQSVAALFQRMPQGWSEVEFNGRRYGVTRTVLIGGQIEKIYAEEFGGTDRISANLYAGDRFRPCEMPAEKVLAFLSAARPR